jgi:hypothetical protein
VRASLDANDGNSAPPPRSVALRFTWVLRYRARTHFKFLCGSSEVSNFDQTGAESQRQTPGTKEGDADKDKVAPR